MVRYGVVFGIQVEGTAEESKDSCEKAGRELLGRNPEEMAAGMSKMTDEQLEHFAKELGAAAKVMTAMGLIMVAERAKRAEMSEMFIEGKELIAC